MIVCLCEGVNDKTIREAVRSGASTVGLLAKITRAGTSCGSCACDLGRLLKCEQERRSPAPSDEEDDRSLAAK